MECDLCPLGDFISQACSLSALDTQPNNFLYVVACTNSAAYAMSGQLNYVLHACNLRAEFNLYELLSRAMPRVLYMCCGRK